MTSSFVWGEVLLYFAPVLVIYAGKVLLPQWTNGRRIKLSIALLPLLLVMIHCFSVLIFSYSLIPYTLLMSALLLGLDLYEYIPKITEFKLLDYFERSRRLLFITWGSLAIALGILRMISLLA